MSTGHTIVLQARSSHLVFTGLQWPLEPLRPCCIGQLKFVPRGATDAHKDFLRETYTTISQI